jgi:hypothetical protein
MDGLEANQQVTSSDAQYLGLAVDSSNSEQTGIDLDYTVGSRTRAHFAIS